MEQRIQITHTHARTHARTHTHVHLVILLVLFYLNSAFSVLLVGRQEGHPACKKPSWWVAGMVILQLHMAQCHSLSLASVKSRLVLPFWYRLTRVVPEKGPLNVCVCVRACVRACVCVCVICIVCFTHTIRYDTIRDTSLT